MLKYMFTKLDLNKQNWEQSKNILEIMAFSSFEHGGKPPKPLISSTPCFVFFLFIPALFKIPL